MKNNLSALSLESLIKQRNLLKGVAIGFGLIILLAFSIVLYMAITKKNFALLSVFPASMVTLLPLMMRYGQINKEITNRKISQ